MTEHVWDIEKERNYCVQNKPGKKYVKKSEELPSFLSSIPQREKDPLVTSFRNPSVEITGPIFFGGCRQYHPKPHGNEISSFSSTLPAADTKEDFWESLFREMIPPVKQYPPRKPFRLVKEPPPLLDLWPHRAPGRLVTVRHGFHRYRPNLGRSKSKIKGETIREIILQIPVDPSLSLELRELVREKKRKLLEMNRQFLPPEKRAAHFHFPKEFINVRVIGPTIPASITICKLRVKGVEDNLTEEEEPVEPCTIEKRTGIESHVVQMDVAENGNTDEITENEFMDDGKEN